MKSVSAISLVSSLGMLLYIGYHVYHSTTISAEAAKSEQQLVMADAALIIPDGLLPQLKNEALEGSVSAARRLFYFYGTINGKEALYWAQILAENGNGQEEYNYGIILQGSLDPTNRARAIYWLNLAKKNGVTKETVEENLLNAIEAQRRGPGPNLGLPDAGVRATGRSSIPQDTRVAPP
jgi:hypothetical protein